MKMKRYLLYLLAAMALTLAGCGRSDVSLGVIGGADGPTAVFVSAASYWWAPFAMIAAVIAGAVIVIMRTRRNRKK